MNVSSHMGQKQLHRNWVPAVGSTNIERSYLSWPPSCQEAHGRPGTLDLLIYDTAHPHVT